MKASSGPFRHSSGSFSQDVWGRRVYPDFVLIEEGQVVSRPEISMRLDLIAAAFFGGKEALVCQVDQPEGIRCFERKDCNTLADGGSLDRLVLPIVQDRSCRAWRIRSATWTAWAPVARWQGNGKFFASPTAKNIGILDGMLNSFGQ